MNEDDAKYALKHVKRVLDEEDITYWLDCGALLGAVREGELIPWDKDIDLGARRRDLDRINEAVQNLPDTMDVEININGPSIIYESCKVSLNIYKFNGKYAKRYFEVPRYFFSSKSGWTLGWLIILVEDEGKYNLVSSCSTKVPDDFVKLISKTFSVIPETISISISKMLKSLRSKSYSKKLVKIPKKYFDTESKIELLDMKFLKPSPVEEYLEYRYGEDWRIPKKDYVFYEDDQAIVNNEIPLNSD